MAPYSTRNGTVDDASSEPLSDCPVGRRRRMLTARAAKYTRPYFEVLRAKMILLAAEGWSNEAIARSFADPAGSGFALAETLF